jgi:uncharacterized protein (UPF0212 family)
MQTGFIPVFEQKFRKLLKTIEKEYEKPKKDRNKDFLKALSKEAKSLRKILKECRADMGTKCCPNCGHEVIIE